MNLPFDLVTNTTTLISIIILLVTLNLVLVFIYYLEYRRNQKLLGIDKKLGESQRLYKRSQESANQLLNSTIEESQLIIDRAYREANTIVTQMRKTAARIDTKTETEITQLVAEGKLNLQNHLNEFSLVFKSSLTELGKTNVDQVKTIQNQIYQETLISLRQMIANLSSEALALQAEVGTQTQAEIKKLQSELESYKSAQIAKINEHLYDIVIAAAKKVLGEGLTLSVEKETVLKAIDDAKKDGLLY